MMPVQPKPGADGSYPVDRATAVSGDKLLRDIMLENKLEMYAAYVREPPAPCLACFLFKLSPLCCHRRLQCFSPYLRCRGS
jgi:hypothetical protein